MAFLPNCDERCRTDKAMPAVVRDEPMADDGRAVAAAEAAVVAVDMAAEELTMDTDEAVSINLPKIIMLMERTTGRLMQPTEQALMHQRVHRAILLQLQRIKMDRVKTPLPVEIKTAWAMANTNTMYLTNRYNT